MDMSLLLRVLAEWLTSSDIVISHSFYLIILYNTHLTVKACEIMSQPITDS